MAHNLTMSGATYGAGKFGQGITAGNGRAYGVAVAGGTFTIEAWVKTGALNSGAMNACGQGGFMSLGMANSNSTVGYAEASYGNSGYQTISTTVNIANDVWHHLELVVSPNIGGAGVGALFFVDGVLAGSGPSPTDYDTTYNDFGVNGTRYAGNIAGAQWSGTVDEVAVWNTARHSAGFTPPTTAYTGGETGLVALWHLDGDGLDSKGTGDTTAPILTSPTGTQTGSTTASGTVTTDEANGTLYSLATVNATETAATVKASGAQQTITSTGVKNVSATGLTTATVYYFHYVHRDAAGNDSARVTSASFTTTSSAATATVVSGPSGGVTGAASTNFTASANGVITGTVVVTPSDGGAGGTFAPTTVSISSGSPTGVFTYTPSSVGAKTLSFSNSGGLANQASLTYTATATQMGLIRFSPYNWNVTSTRATSINPGAYFSTIFSGATCALTFDLTGETGYPSGFWYRIDKNGPWRFADIAATVTLDMTGGDPNFTTNGGHLLEVVYRYMDGAAANRWNPQQCAIVLTGIVLAAGATLTLPPTVRGRNALVFGDSIVEGVLTYSGSYSMDAMSGWAFEACEALGCEFGIVGFASQGFASAGIPATPIFGSTWNYIYNTVARTFSPAPDLIVINHGTNDGTANITSAATAVLTAMLAATPSTTKIVVMQPFNGNRAANLQAAVAAVANARCTYLDTTGWYDQTANGNRLHPLAVVTATDIAPRAINALAPILYGALAAPSLTARTVSVTLGDTGGASANLTGLKVAFYDEASPDLHTTPRYQSAAQTTNGAGVLTFSVNSTLAAGGTGHLVALSATGQHFNGPVVVS